MISKTAVRERQKHVLLVDDNEDILEALGTGLGHRGYKVSMYSDPSEALKAFTATHFDVAVLDVRMQPMDGLELCSKLKEIDPQLPICFLTAYADTVTQWPDHALLVQKPITLDGLTMALQDIESRNK